MALRSVEVILNDIYIGSKLSTDNVCLADTRLILDIPALVYNDYYIEFLILNTLSCILQFSIIYFSYEFKKNTVQIFDDKKKKVAIILFYFYFIFNTLFVHEVELG